MNRVILMGRLTADPDIRYTQGENATAYGFYTLAVDRRMKKDPNKPDQQTADFPRCIVNGKNAEFAKNYLRKGMRIIVEGSLRTGSYTKDNVKIFTTDVSVMSQEFCEGKKDADGNGSATSAADSSAPIGGGNPLTADESWMQSGEEDLPFR